MAVLIQNLNRALFCLILTPGNKISFLGSYKKALTRCCNDPLRPPDLSGLGRFICISHHVSSWAECALVSRFTTQVELWFAG